MPARLGLAGMRKLTQCPVVQKSKEARLCQLRMADVPALARNYPPRNFLVVCGGGSRLRSSAVAVASSGHGFGGDGHRDNNSSDENDAEQENRRPGLPGLHCRSFLESVWASFLEDFGSTRPWRRSQGQGVEPALRSPFSGGSVQHFLKWPGRFWWPD